MGPASLLQPLYDAQAQVEWLARDRQRLIDQVRALCTPPDAPLVSALVPDPVDFSVWHVLRGSREALALVVNCRRDLQACQAALEVTGRAMAAERARADRLEASLASAHRQLDEVVARAAAAESLVLEFGAEEAG